MSFIGSMIETWRDRREQAAVRRALDFMGPEQAQAFAADLNLNLSDLKQVLERGAEAPRLMFRMLSARGLVAANVEPRTMRDLESTCSRCDCKARCRRELDAGTATLNAASFCPNDHLMGVMKARLAA